MYIPSAYKVTDRSETLGFIHGRGFATVITQMNGIPWASHLPVLLDEGEEGDVLRSHMAKNNEQWRHFESGTEVLCIFHGPHSYISPSWYTAKIAVPTWNYATVHAYGIPQVEMDPAYIRKVVDDTTLKYESKMNVPWRMNLPDDAISGMLAAIVGFSIRITRLEAKFKLGQNRLPEDQKGMLRALKESESLESKQLAEFIDRRNKRPNQTP